MTFPRAVLLSARDLELIRGALGEKADALEAYARWVDDRPQLPGVEAALGRIRAEAAEAQTLLLRLYKVETLAQSVALAGDDPTTNGTSS